MQIGRIRGIGQDVLGPGLRVGIWTRGCMRRCPGCMSEDLWLPDPACDLDVALAAGLVAGIYATGPFAGITVSGGEPFDQKDDLLLLLERLRGTADDLLLYSGLTPVEAGRRLGPRGLRRLEGRVAVLVLGPYVAALDDGRDPLRGSSNQTILVAEAFRDRYEPWLDGTRTRRIEGVLERDTVRLTGMPPR